MSFCLLQSCTAHACIACIFAFVQRFAKKQAPIGTALAPRYCSQHGQCAVSRPSRRIALLCPLFSLPVLSLLLLLGLTQAAVTGVDINRFVMALRSLGSNQYALEEVINAPIGNVFQQLCQLGSQYPLSPLTARLEVLTTHPFGVGSKWQEHRRHLFLRDVMKCEVLQCGPRALSIVSSDGNSLFHVCSGSPAQFGCLEWSWTMVLHAIHSQLLCRLQPAQIQL